MKSQYARTASDFLLYLSVNIIFLIEFFSRKSAEARRKEYIING